MRHKYILDKIGELYPEATLFYRPNTLLINIMNVVDNIIIEKKNISDLYEFEDFLLNKSSLFKLLKDFMDIDQVNELRKIVRDHGIKSDIIKVGNKFLTKHKVKKWLLDE